MRPHFSLLPLSALLLAIGPAASAGCTSAATPNDTVVVDASTTPPPPRVCKPPVETAAPSSAQPWFTSATADVGLAAQGAFEPRAHTIIAADLDGDGWVDLFAQTGHAQRGTLEEGPLAGKRTRFVLMNRPDSATPSRRIYVDATVDSGILATRDGKGDHGYGVVNLGDLDGNGTVDAITCSPDPQPDKDPCTAYLNDGKGHFTIAPPSSLDKKTFWVPSATLFDFDRDGILDFWPATIAHWPYPVEPPIDDQPPTLFQGNGDGTFSNVSKAVGLPTKDGLDADGTSWRHVFGITACDIDGDGDDDIIFASYGRQENQVWRNDNGKFTNVAHELGLDYDHRADFSDDQSYRCWCQANTTKCPAGVPAPEPASFCGAFNGKYGRGWQPGITDQPWALGGNNFTIACGDINDDGHFDLVSATIVHGDVGSAADPSEIILNPGGPGKFLRPGNDKTGLLRKETGIYWNHGDSMAVMVDIDLDGRKDIWMNQTGAYGVADRAHLWHQRPDGTFEEMGITSGLVPKDGKPNSYNPAFVDIDGDGDLDLVIGDTGDGNLRVFRNEVGQAQNFVRVHLVGKGAGASNTSAIGAVVKVTAGGRTQTQRVSGGYGLSNVQADLVLTFGLGAACDIDAIEVRWPDAAGTTSKVEHVLANYTVELREGETDARYPYADREKTR